MRSPSCLAAKRASQPNRCISFSILLSWVNVALSNSFTLRLWQPKMNNSFLYAVIMFVAGVGIPTMAALNGGLGARLQSPALASVILFAAALLIAIPYLLITQGIPKAIYSAGIPWYFYGGGVFVMFYIVTITWVAPRFGLTNAVAFVLLGQLAAMSTIDHFGLFGVLKNSLSTQRCIGLVVMAVGVFMVLSRKTS